VPHSRRSECILSVILDRTIWRSIQTGNHGRFGISISLAGSGVGLGSGLLRGNSIVPAAPPHPILPARDDQRWGSRHYRYQGGAGVQENSPTCGSTPKATFSLSPMTTLHWPRLSGGSLIWSRAGSEAKLRTVRLSKCKARSRRPLCVKCWGCVDTEESQSGSRRDP
jgi:hypothetical protein